MTRLDPSRPYEVEHRDVVYAEPDGERLLARVHAPVGGPTAGRPAVVQVHGGAWRYFDRTADTALNRALAACGMVVVALDVRQAPNHRWPVAAADVVTGLRWVRDHGDELGVTTDDLGVIGCSSGGQLALTAGLAPSDVELGEVGGAEVAYVAGLWPVGQPDARYRYLLDRYRLAPDAVTDPTFECVRLIRAQDRFFPSELAMAEASVVRMLQDGVPRHLPPVWVAHAEHDEQVTREMSEALGRALQAAGARVEVTLFTGVAHAFFDDGGEPADLCLAHLTRFIEGCLRSKTDTHVR